jgi:hypothetical protein
VLSPPTHTSALQLTHSLTRPLTRPAFTTGISGKSQILFSITYITRYLDVFFTFISAYNSLMKVLFVSASCATVYVVAPPPPPTHTICKQDVIVNTTRC